MCLYVLVQLEDPAIRWQMALYRDLPNYYEETSDPERTVERVLDIAHVLFHLDQVCVCLWRIKDDTEWRTIATLYVRDHSRTDVI